MVKIFLDGPTLEEVKDYREAVDGFTTNPILLKKIGVTDYESWAKEALSLTDLPFAFEVLSDNFKEMKRQAVKIASWGENVNVKIPITTTTGKSCIPVIVDLFDKGIKVNITAVTSIKQVTQLMPIFYNGGEGYLSVFAGRIADVGIDPAPVISKVLYLLKETPNIELIWASAREIYNAVQADNMDCHIITLSIDLFKKYPYLGKSLDKVSLDTVRMFFEAGKNFKL